MHDKLHFSGDPNADRGFWSPSTSAAKYSHFLSSSIVVIQRSALLINMLSSFCEEDYAVTRYIAEFINSLSNLAYVFLAVNYAKRNNAQHDLTSASLVIVGIASFLFHSTLRLPAQFCDDISMLFLAGALLRTLYCARQSASHASFLTISIYTSVCVMSAFYIQSGNLLVHVSMFVGMLMLIWPRTLYLIVYRKDRDTLLVKFGVAVGYLATAFLVWNIDLNMCHELRNLRTELGLPWAWGLELHGWWHILTAVGAATYMELIRDLCY